MDATVLLSQPRNLPVPRAPEPLTPLGLSLEPCLDVISLSEQQNPSLSTHLQQTCTLWVLLCTWLVSGWFLHRTPCPTSHPPPPGVWHWGAESSGRTHLPNRKGWGWVWV